VPVRECIFETTELFGAVLAYIAPDISGSDGAKTGKAISIGIHISIQFIPIPVKIIAPLAIPKSLPFGVGIITIIHVQFAAFGDVDQGCVGFAEKEEGFGGAEVKYATLVAAGGAGVIGINAIGQVKF
jgi:hypothetical protein